MFCHGLLTAIVVKDDDKFGNGRLYGVPVHSLITDAEFIRLVTQDTGITPVLEPVELAGFLHPPSAMAGARTPGSLLAAGVEAVDFTGRRLELAELAAWRDGSGDFSVMLITGEGGQGKTRLARRFTAVARQKRWATGFLANRSAAITQDDGNHLLAASDLAKRIQEATEPVLIVTDYAETRPGEVARLIEILASRPVVPPARLLLLSRTAGAWWDNLTDALPPGTTHHIPLESLTEVGQSRHDAYAAAVVSLARPP